MRPRHALGPRARRAPAASLRLLGLLLLAGAAFAPAAQAGEVWSGTITVGQNGNWTGFTKPPPISPVENTGSLSSETFTLGGTTYTIKAIAVSTGAGFYFSASPSLADHKDRLVLYFTNEADSTMETAVALSDTQSLVGINDQPYFYLETGFTADTLPGGHDAMGDTAAVRLVSTDPIWISEMTVGASDSIRGFSSADSYGRLDPVALSHGGVDYTIEQLSFGSGSDEEGIWMSANIGDDAGFADLVLEVGGHEVPVEGRRVDPLKKVWFENLPDDLNGGFSVNRTLPEGAVATLCLRTADEVCPTGSITMPTAIWTSTMTVGTSDMGQPDANDNRGFSSVTGSTYGALDPATLSHDSVDYTVERLTFATTEGRYGLWFDANIANNKADGFANLVLEIGGHEVPVTGRNSSAQKMLDFGTLPTDLGTGNYADTLAVGAEVTVCLRTADQTCPAGSITIPVTPPVWTTTVTIGEVASGINGYDSDQDPTVGALGEDEFEYGGTTYTVTQLRAASQSIWFGVSSAGLPVDDTLTLELANTSTAGKWVQVFNVRKAHSTTVDWFFQDDGEDDFHLLFPVGGMATVCLRPTARTTCPAASFTPLDQNIATGAPTISGVAQVGATLTASTSEIMDDDGLTSVSYSYQWIREDSDGTNPVDITGATSSSYLLAAADVDKKIKVKVSFTDDDGNAEELTSAASETVVAAAATTVTIAADEPVITNALSHMNFTLTRTGVTTAALTVTVTLAQTRQFLSNSRLIGSHTAEFDANDTTADFQIHVANLRRTVDEDGELTASVAPGTGYGVGTPGAAIVAVKAANPAMTVGFEQAAYEVREDVAGGKATVHVKAQMAAGFPPPNLEWPTAAVSTQGDDATEPDDYAAVLETVNIAPGDWVEVGGRFEARVAVDVTLVNDGLVEPDESLDLIIEKAGNAPIDVVKAVHPNGDDCPVGECTSTLTILNDDAVPTLDTATVNGTSLVLTYDKTLDGDSDPAAGQYSVVVGTATVTPDGVDAEGKTVTLTLDDAVTSGQTVTVSYTVPSTNPVQDADSQKAVALDAQPVHNAAGDSTAPSRLSALVRGATLVLMYDEALDTGSTPAAGDFNVQVTPEGESAARRDVSTVEVSGSRVILTLASAVLVSDATSLSYTVPGTNPVQDVAGNDAAALTSVSVRHRDDTSPINTAATGAPTISGTAQVGQTLTASTSAIMDDDGLTSPTYAYQWIRVDADGNSNPADITGATSATYQPAVADEGRTLKVAVTFQDDDGNDEGPLTSAASDKVLAANTDPIWTASMKVGSQVNPNDRGFRAGTTSSNYGLLDRDSFEHDGVTYTVRRLTVTTSAGERGIWMTADIADDKAAGFADLVLEIGGHVVPVTGRPFVLARQRLVFGTLPSALSGVRYLTTLPRGVQATVCLRTAGQLCPSGSLTPDTEVPELDGDPTVDGDQLLLTYDELIDFDALPPTSAFTVVAAGATIAVSTVFAVAEPRTAYRYDEVTLTLASAVTIGQTVTVSYAVPSGANKLKDRAGNDAAALSDQAVTNVTREATPPVLDGAPTVDGDELVLTYSEALNESSTPPTTAYTVMAAGTAIAVSTVTVSDTTVTLDLASAVTAGQAVTVSYAVPTGMGAMPVEDVAGNDAAALTAWEVINTTGDTTAPALNGDPTVDGDELVLSYGEALNERSMPTTTAYTVMAAGTAIAVSTVTVSGTTVTLDLASAVTAGQAVTVSYAVPTGMNAMPVEDPAGNDAAALSARAVINTTGDTTPPALDGATVDGATLVMTFNEPLDSSTDGIPPTTNLEVVVNSVTVTVADVAVRWDEVTLTLAVAVQSGDTVTVEYLGPSAESDPEIQDGAGNKALAFASAAPVTNNTGDTRAPELTGDPTVDGDELVLTYDEALNGSSTPPTSAYTVVAASVTIAVSTVTVSGMTVTLDLASAVTIGQTVTVSYTVPTGGSAMPVEDTDGNDAAALSDQAVTNNTPDVRAPELDGAPTVVGDELVLTYDEALSGSSTPPTSAYTVVAAGVTIAVSTVTVSGMTVTLDLASAVTIGQTVTVSYTVPTGGSAMPVEDPAGNDAAALSDRAVTNNTGDVRAPELDGDPTVVGDELVLTYDEALNGSSTPPTSAYTVVAAGVTIAVSTVTVSGMTVTLDLASAVTIGQTVTVSYTVPTGGSAMPVEDPAGNDAAALSDRAVTNNTGDVRAPELDGDPTVVGDELVLTYDEALNGSSTPPTSAYTVVAAGVTIAVSTVTVSGMTVTLDLTSAVAAGQTVTVSYTVPTGVNAMPVEDTDGNDAAALSARAVDNNTMQTNRAPVFDAATASRSVAENTAPAVDIGAAVMATDADDDTLEYTLEGADAEAFRIVSTSGQLQTRAALNYEARPSYTVTVKADDGNGGTGTIAVSIQVMNVDEPPGPPTALQARPGDGEMALTWTAPSDHGDGPVTAYEVELDESGDWTETDGVATRHTVTGLVNGRLYRFRVRAVNEAGSGSASAAVSARPQARTAAAEKAWLARFGRTVAGQVAEAVSERLSAPTAEAELKMGGAAVESALLSGALRTLAGETEPDGRQMLAGGSFVLPLGATGADGWVAWGRGAYSEFDGEEGRARLDGEVRGGMLGVDRVRGAWRLGLALSHREGDGTVREAGEPAYALESKLTSAHPYARWQVRDGLSVWGMLGWGEGELERRRSGTTAETDLEMRLAVLGADGALGAWRGFGLTLKSEVLAVRLETDEAEGFPEIEADATRLRLRLAGAGGHRLASGGRLAPRLEAGLRWDAGDAEHGLGVELGAGLRYADASGRLTAELSARGLLAHEEGEYEEWGVGGSVALRPDAAGRGFSLTLESALGVTGSGTDELWARRDLSGLVKEQDAASGGRFGAELGYGLNGRGGRGVLTPYLGYERDRGANVWHLGGRLENGPAWALDLEGRLRHGVQETGHELVLGLSGRW